MLSYAINRGSSRAGKPFIWPFPAIGQVEPDQELTLRIVFYADEVFAPRFTLSEGDMKDVLVLQVANGRDTFITIQAKFAPSAIGLPLQLLSSLPSSPRTMTPAQRHALAVMKANPVEHDKASAKPARPIWAMLEYLMAHAAKDAWVEGEVALDELLPVLDVRLIRSLRCG